MSSTVRCWEYRDNKEGVPVPKEPQSWEAAREGSSHLQNMVMNGVLRGAQWTVGTERKSIYPSKGLAHQETFWKLRSLT